MSQLLFEPTEHRIGESDSIFITSKNAGEPVLCAVCNDVAAFIINALYPDDIHRTELADMVEAEFSLTAEEAMEAVEDVINALQSEG